MEINGFMEYLKREKKASDNTCEAYRRDIEAFGRFLAGREAAGAVEGDWRGRGGLPAGAEK